VLLVQGSTILVKLAEQFLPYDGGWSANLENIVRK